MSSTTVDSPFADAVVDEDERSRGPSRQPACDTGGEPP